MENEHPGILLKRIRESKVITQYQLAAITGLNRTYINKLEKGTPSTITLTVARKLAKGLKVRPEIFLSTNDSEEMFQYEERFETILRDIKKRYKLGSNKQ